MPTSEMPVLIVLGAPNDPQGRLLPAAEGRAQAALRAYQREPQLRILLTGGFGAHFNQTARPHHEYVAEYLEAAGVPKAAFLGGVASTNTVDDARLCAAFLSSLQIPLRLLVVTSDFHLARARLLFARAIPDARLEMVAAPSGLPPAELVQALRHEADAIARLTS